MWFSQSSWRGLHFQPGAISDQQPCSCCCWIHLGFSRAPVWPHPRKTRTCRVHHQESSSPAVQLKLLLALAELEIRLRAPELQGWLGRGGWGTGTGHKVTVTRAGASLGTQHQALPAPLGSKRLIRGKNCHWGMEKGGGSGKA